MKKKVFMALLATASFAVLLASGLVFTGCGEDEGLFYFTNSSTHTVTVSAVGGASAFTLASWETKSFVITGELRTTDLIYQPANLVSVSKSGRTFTFRNR